MADLRYITEYLPLRRHREEMQQAARQRRWRLLVGVIIVVALTGAGYALTPPLGLMLAGIGAMILFFATMTGGSSVPADQLTGIEGEVRTLKFLEQLGDDHVIFNQVMVPDASLPGGRRELDFVVVGPGGVDIVEVKNTPGLIYVAPDSKHWQVAQRGCCGSSPGWHAMDNPLRQVSAQVSAVERWLLSHGISDSVRGMICFARPEVALENVASSPVPVVVPEQLVQTIAAVRPVTSLNPRQRLGLVELLGPGLNRPRLAA